ncbi:MAG: DUF1570 domain-containing protein [Candidatus Omnitrophica bacterium]|nr:DUF1570 domain-containing protein [Candidatus Omnitrophota bacterium]
MKRLLAGLILLSLVLSAVYLVAWRRPELLPAQVTDWLNAHHWLPPPPEPATGHPTSLDPHGGGRAASGSTVPLEKLITLRLKNGTVLSGELLNETPEAITLGWSWGSTEFRRTEIASAERGKRVTTDAQLLPPLSTETGQATWPYHHDVVVQLTNTAILDAAISEVHPDRIVLQTAAAGGLAEQEIPRSRIEGLLFRPIENERSTQISDTLYRLFPSMQRYHDGWFTLVTDSYAPAVREYRKTIRGYATELYLAFFAQVKDRHPAVQTFIVVFDDWGKFVEYALSDGLPGWALLGYFSPTDEVLYLFNGLGESFADLLYEVYLARARRGVNQLATQVKGQVDSRYGVFVDGQATEIKGKFEALHDYVRGQYSRETLATLRHEMTHELFHHWGLQSIVLSQTDPHDAERVAKKREFLATKDLKQKRRLLEELLNPQQHDEDVQMSAANSWLVEGLAAYAETDPLGSTNERWLAAYQEAKRKQAVLPLEFLTVFKMGSFWGVAPQAQIYAYAESWAFVHFLMTHYRDGFLRYMERMAAQTPKEGEDLQWLLEATHQELRSLEKEFFAYLEQFPQQTDPFLQFIDKIQEIFGTR